MTFLARQVENRGRWGAALAVAAYSVLAAGVLLVGLLAGVLTVGGAR